MRAETERGKASYGGRALYSRSYLNLARVEIDFGRAFPNDRSQAHSRAQRCVEHARSLDPDHEMTDEMQSILALTSTT